MNRRLDRLVGVPLLKALAPFAARVPAIPAAPARILVLKLAAAGDTVLLVPTLRALRRRFPAARIHWLVSPINADIARTVPYVDAWTMCIRSPPPMVSRRNSVNTSNAMLRNPTVDRRSGGRSLKDTQSTFRMSLPIRSGSARSSRALLASELLSACRCCVRE